MPPALPHQLLTLGRLALLNAAGDDVLPRDVTKPLAVLAFLAAAPGRRCSRERLVDLFWGDSTLEAGRASLRQVIYRLREVLGDAALQSESTDLHLTPDLATDRDAFLAALERGELDRALALYRGAYVADFVSRGTTQFEQWRDQEQDRLHDLFTNTIDVAGQRALNEGRAAEAAALAQRVLEEHPLDERGWRLRLQAEQLAGSRIHLTASIAELRRRFADEGWELQPRTTQLVEALERSRADVSEQPQGGLLDGDLVGRDAVMATLYQQWRQASRRTGTHVHLVGGAGLGKSRVMEDFAVRLRSERGRVANVGAYPRQRYVQGATLASVVAALADLPGSGGISAESARILIEVQPTVSSRFPAAAPPTASAPHSRDAVVGEALRDLLDAVTENGAVCLMLDDAHWWDDASRHTIEAAIERLSDRAILVVTASRPGAGEIATGLDHHSVELLRWQTGEVLVLLRSLGTVEDPDAATTLAETLAAAAEGVPLLVLEALRLGLDRELLTLRDQRWGFPGLGALLTLLRPGQLLRERASTLTIRQRHLLLLTWLLDSELTHDDWHTVDAESHGGTIAELERLGFLVAGGRGWKVAHDAIGEAIEEAASPEEQRAAHRDAGLLALQRGDLPIVLRQVAAHAIEAGDSSLQHQVALRWVRQRRALGATSSAAHLIGEVFPEQLTDTARHAIVRELPAELRHRPWSARRLAPIWAVAGAAVVLGAFALFEQPQPPDMILGLYGADPSGRGFEHRLALRHDAWGTDAGAAIGTPPDGEEPAWGSTPADSLSNGPIGDPTGSRWIFARTVSDSGEPTELVLHSASGERVLAAASSDDAQPAWSPDGNAVVFQTTRWTTNGNTNFDLAVVDVATDRVRRLTSDGGDEVTPIWSPDGTRIAYIKHLDRNRPDSLCWIAIDGMLGECRADGDRPLNSVLGWRDFNNVVISGQEGEQCRFPSINLESGVSVPLVPLGPCASSLSPDARWLAWTLTGTNLGTASKVIVTSLSGVTASREIELPTGPGGSLGTYWRGPWHPAVLAGVAVRHRGDSLVPDVPYQLELRGRDVEAHDVTISPRVVRWWSSDPSIATVDSTGLVHARRIGAVHIYGSAGGWRVDSVRLVVANHLPSIAYSEDWSGDWTSRWRTGGDPRPIVTGGGARGASFLLVNGDRFYVSSAYSKAVFDPRQGLALDVEMTTPITQSKWQHLRVGLSAVTGSVRGGLVGSGGCSLSYPAGEGWEARTRANSQAGSVEVGNSLGTGDWYRVRVQVFPDGTCGFAINGKPVRRSAVGFAPREPVSVTIEGQTVGSNLLVGALKVWNGIPRDIDWSKLRQPP